MSERGEGAYEELTSGVFGGGGAKVGVDIRSYPFELS